MIALLLSLALALQGIPVQAQQAGTVSGVLKDSQGKPLAGIRMAALARPQSLDEAVTSPAMSSLAETDEQGRYTLEGIPPGRYFIAAGRLDAQTYYPGTPDLALAKEVAITPGSMVSGIDFSLGDLSFGRASSSINVSSTVSIPLRVTVEGGGKVPVSGGGKFITVKLDMGTSVIAAPITNTTVNIPGPQTTAYRVTVENLPETYAVKSMTYGTTDLMTNTLRLTPTNFPGSATRIVQLVSSAPVSPTGPVGQLTTAQIATNLQYELARLSFGVTPGTTSPQPASTPAATAPPPGAAAGTPVVLQFGTVPQDPAALQAYLAGMAAALAGQTPAAAAAAATRAGGGPVIVLSSPQPAATPPSVLYITLAPAPLKATTGVRVSGRMSVAGRRTVYVSGIPGAVYSDGTFEVIGVPPGRHAVATRDNPTGASPLAASVVVGDASLDGIVLEETAMLPLQASEPATPRPAGEHGIGIVPLARITGILIEEISRKPIPEGTVSIKANGYYSASFPVDSEGRFGLPPLLPGTYEVDVQIFGHSNIRQTFEIDDKDLKLELISRKLY